MSARLLFAFVAVLVAALGACSSSYSPEVTAPGTSCFEDSDCEPAGICVTDGAVRVCTRECGAVGPTPECPDGWRCGEGDESHPTVCRCESAGPERCNDRDDDCDGAIDEIPCPDTPGDPDGCGTTLECFDVRTTAIDAVDLLFVIDDSGSMAYEQNALARELPRMFTALARGDRNGDGVGDLPPVRSLHVGVVSTDMGVGGFTLPTCTGRFGDDGVLLTRGDPARPGCVEAYPSFFAFMPEDGTDELAQGVGCVVTMGTAGCGFEQQLEATLKAVTPSTGLARFENGTVGHADGQNAGFLRPDSVLLIVLLTEEEDCSAANPAIFDPTDTSFDGSLSTRCFEYGAPELGFVHPIERYVDGLIATRPDATRLVVSGIVGIPEVTTPRPGAIPDWEAILDHPDMQEIPDPAMPSRLRPSCDRTDPSGERSLAFPPRRIVRTLQGLDRIGAHATVQSICQDSLTPAIDATLSTLDDAMTPCFLRSIDPSRCRLLETLPVGRVCEELPGRAVIDRVRDSSGQTVEICEVAPGAGDGWSYTPNDPSCPATRPNRVHVSTPPLDASRLRLVCAR
jgi:hypothetical protein